MAIPNKSTAPGDEPEPLAEPAPDSLPASSGGDGTRKALLELRAASLGRRWAQQRRLELHEEGRPAAGGWPGTVREARARVEQVLLPEVLRRKMSAITPAERERAARTAYASARSEWHRHAEPEET